MKIAIVAPGRTLAPDAAARVQGLAAGKADLHIHPQCFLQYGHFAGDDAARANAFLEVANDPSFDAVWFARGGYGAGRLMAHIAPRLTPAALQKIYLGYSDTGFLLALLHKAGADLVAHAPMPTDITREDGDAAITRVLDFLAGDFAGVESSARDAHAPQLAFNLSVLRSLMGTRVQPDFRNAVVMVEDVAEYAYALDRGLCHLFSSDAFLQARGVRQGRFSDVPDNDVAFPVPVSALCQEWCAATGVAYLGEANIGHDSANAIVPFHPVRMRERLGVSA